MVLCWQPRLNDEVALEQATRACSRISSCVATSSAEGDVFGGFQVPGLPNFWYQITGEKIIALADIYEVSEQYRVSKKSESEGGKANGSADTQESGELETLDFKETHDP